MHDSGKVILGLGVFVVLMTSPIWYNVASGKGSYEPNPVLPKEGQCVESAAYMKDYHMTMLNTWRNDVIRNDQRTYRASNGEIYNKSLTNTCLKCHSNKTEFCDKCHNYMDVSPPCFNCHVVPEEKAP